MNISVSQSQPAQVLNKTQPQKQTIAATAAATEKNSIAADSLAIKKGVMPTLKGGLLGGVAGGALAGAGAFAVAKATRADYAELAILMGGGLGAIAGGVTGAVVANMTDNKTKASLYGAAVGAAVGAGIGIIGGDVKSALAWGAIGLGSGLGGAYAGSLVAKR